MNGILLGPWAHQIDQGWPGYASFSAANAQAEGHESSPQRNTPAGTLRTLDEMES